MSPIICTYKVSNRYLETCRKQFEKRRTIQNMQKHNRQDSENTIWKQTTNRTYVEKYREGYLSTEFDLFWFMMPLLEKKWINLLLAVKYIKVTQGSIRHFVPPIEWVYQLSSWYLKAGWKKSRRTDWRTSPLQYTTVFYFQREYENACNFKPKRSDVNVSLGIVIWKKNCLWCLYMYTCPISHLVFWLDIATCTIPLSHHHVCIWFINCIPIFIYISYICCIYMYHVYTRAMNKHVELRSILRDNQGFCKAWYIFIFIIIVSYKARLPNDIYIYHCAFPTA